MKHHRLNSGLSARIRSDNYYRGFFSVVDGGGLVDAITSGTGTSTRFSFFDLNNWVTSAGKMMFHVIGAMSEFERSLIVERVRAGMALAKVKGKAIGRKPTSVLHIEKILSIAEDDNLSVREIAKKACMPRTVFRAIRQFKAGQIGREGLPVKAY